MESFEDFEALDPNKIDYQTVGHIKPNKIFCFIKPCQVLYGNIKDWSLFVKITIHVQSFFQKTSQHSEIFPKS